MTVEEITWIDSGKSWGAGWYGLEWIVEQAKAWSGINTTTGYVIYEDERSVVVAQTIDREADNFANLFLIYKACITNRREL